MSSFGSIHSVRSGLDAARRALDVVGHNIANASTQGYTRQEVSFVAAEPANVIKSAGRGISDTLVLRYRDEFLDRAFRARAGLQGFYDTLSNQLGQVEEVIGDLSETGLRTELDQFFNAWDTLAMRPSDSAARALVVSAAQSFIDMARSVSDDLAGIRTNADDAIRNKVDEINKAAKQIANLNQEIMHKEVSRQPANELRDQRDRLLDSLAKLAGTTVVAHSDGAVTVQLGSMPIVDRHVAYPIVTNTGAPDSFGQVTTALLWNPPTPIPATATPAPFASGEVAGLAKLRDEAVPKYMTYLDNLVKTVANEVNRIHTGADKVPPEAQILFFTGADGTSPIGAGYMDVALSQVIAADPSRIIAAETVPAAPATPAPGDGGRALRIAQLRNAKVATGDPVGSLQVTPGEYLRAISSHLGIDLQQAQRQAEAAALQVDQAEKHRQSVSGVSLDDEMTKMIQFQQTYNAAARMMTTLDEMLDVIVNRVGLVGR